MVNPATSSDLTPVQLAMVEAAILAPSPDNNQPWKFRATESGLQVYMDTGRSLPSDQSSMFDLTSIGAAVENAIIAASQHGYRAEPVWQGFDGDHPSSDQSIVELRLDSGADPDPLFASIPNRCTCRKPYSSEPLSTSVLQQLTESISRFESVQIDWITEAANKKRFGKLIASTDSLRFRTQAFHEELYRQLRFKRSEVESTRDGLDVRTLELPPGVTTMLRLLKYWRVMQMVHSLRMTPLLTMPSKVAVERSGAIAVISVPNASTADFLAGGRAIQRLWLQANSSGLSMHPLGSLPIFLLQSNPDPAFTRVIEHARLGVAELLPSATNRVIQLAFRVGLSDPPTVRSLRRSPAELFDR